MKKVRGVGSLVAFDCASPEARDDVISRMANKGTICDSIQNTIVCSLT